MSDDAAAGPAPHVGKSLLLGVDGGGTKTAAWLAALDAPAAPVVLGRGLAGCSNPRAVGIETAQSVLAQAIAAAWADAQLAARPVDYAVLAVAGSGQTDVAAALTRWCVASRLAAQADMVHDAEAVLAAGAPGGWGVALIAGTGSSAVAIAPDGVRHVCGGWGYRFGDEGSGYWLGRQALAAVSHAADGRGPATALTEQILAHFGATEPRSVNAALDAAPNDRQAIAALAPRVIAAAQDGDPVAGGLLEEAAVALAAVVTGAARAAKLPRKFPLALAGGVLCGCESLRTALTARLVDADAPPGAVQLTLHPVEGCVQLAARRVTAVGK